MYKNISNSSKNPFFKVELIIKELQGNISPVILGLVKLKRMNFIRLNIVIDHDLKIGGCVAWLTVNNKKVVFIDTEDSSKIKDDYLKSSDYYLKRMLNKDNGNEDNKKLLPLGLNYIMDNNSWKLLGALLASGNFKKVINKIPHFFSFFSFLAGREYAMAAVPAKDFYGYPIYRDSPKITFYTRLFNPGKNEKLNDERIQIIRILRKTFGSRFEGGLRTDARTMKFAPDLAIPLYKTKRKVFINNLSKFDIGITNAGLENSIGCKVAEYCMKSMGIVQNDISDYIIPGDFEENTNYFKYCNMDDLLTKVEMLLTNQEYLMHMKIENFKYTSHYLYPERYLWEVLMNIMN